MEGLWVGYLSVGRYCHGNITMGQFCGTRDQGSLPNECLAGQEHWKAPYPGFNHRSEWILWSVDDMYHC